MRVRQIVGCAGLLWLSVVGAAPAAGRSDIADAAMNGDRAAVERLLTQKADVNAPQIDGATALHWAVYRDDLALADVLVRAKANVKAANRVGVTPLAMASLYGRPAMIDRLLKAGADVKERGPNGETMVMFAARNGNPKAVRVLIDAGADVNAKEKTRGTTALMWAVEQKHPEAAKELLKAGADPSVTSGPAGLPRNYIASRVDVPALEQAQERRRRAAASGRTYEEQHALDQQQGRAPSGQHPAPQPADADAESVVAGLVGSGGGGLTPLVFAAREGDLESAKALLDAGANVNQTTEYNWTPLLTAVNNRNYTLATFLIDRGADPNIANKGGWTPLYLATDNRNIEGGDYPVPKADLDHLDMIRTLLEAGANPNARVKDNTLTRTIFTMQWFFEDGATAFVRASQSSDTALMRLLLEHGADPKLPTANNDNAITAASGIGWVEGVTYERSAKENLEAMRMLLDLGLDANQANDEGRRPLMGAALKGRHDVIHLLVERGAKLDAYDKGSRDTDNPDSAAAGHQWQAIDYAEGLVRVGVQSAVARPDTVALIRTMMVERGMPVPPVDRTILSVCVVALCQGVK